MYIYICNYNNLCKHKDIIPRNNQQLKISKTPKFHFLKWTIGYR